MGKREGNIGFVYDFVNFMFDFHQIERRWQSSYELKCFIIESVAVEKLRGYDKSHASYPLIIQRIIKKYCCVDTAGRNSPNYSVSSQNSNVAYCNQTNQMFQSYQNCRGQSVC